MGCCALHELITILILDFTIKTLCLLCVGSHDSRMKKKLIEGEAVFDHLAVWYYIAAILAGASEI